MSKNYQPENARFDAKHSKFWLAQKYPKIDISRGYKWKCQTNLALESKWDCQSLQQVFNVIGWQQRQDGQVILNTYIYIYICVFKLYIYIY